MLRNYQIVENGEFKAFLKDLLERDVLDKTALGITKHVISNGVKNLSDKQLSVFKKYVIEEYTIDGCIGCGGEIPWSEMFKAATGTKLCSHCESKMDDRN